MKVLSAEVKTELLSLAREGHGLHSCCEQVGLEVSVVREFLATQDGFRFAVSLEFAAQRAEIRALAAALGSRGVPVRLRRMK